MWKEELGHYGPAKASLIRILFKLQAFELGLGTLLSILQALLFSVARPLLLGQIIYLVADPNSTNLQGVMYALLFAAVILSEAIVQAQVKQLLSCRLGARFISWMTSLVCEKSMTVSTAAASSSGLQESALVGGDITRMVEEWKWLCLVVYVTFALIGGICVLAFTLGTSSLVGFAIMFSITFGNYRIARVIKKVEEKDFAAGDQRIGYLREILAGIKAIKMMAWEVPFQNQLISARDKEADYIRQFRSMSVTSINLGRASPVLAACFSILTLALTDPANLTAARIFVAISSFQGLRLPLIAISQHLTLMANTLVSFERLRRYLLLEDAVKPKPLPDSSNDVVVVENATFRWSQQTLSGNGERASRTSRGPSFGEAASAAIKPQLTKKFTSGRIDFYLDNISFRVRRDNHLVAVVGRVGSGKTSLLSSVLGSMFLHGSGSVQLGRKVGYIPQKPFVMSGTILDNLLMGTEEDPALFQRVLRASALDVDLDSLPNGMETEIGERGQTLSGGQAARVGIARALYTQPELLVLDDPLSAVDPEVANNLFRRSVLGYLGRYGDLYSDAPPHAHDIQKAKSSPPKRRAVLMTLNQLHLLPHFDHVIVLQDGRIAEQGTFAELSACKSGVLTQMLSGVESSATDQEDIERLYAQEVLEQEQGRNRDDLETNEEEGEQPNAAAAAAAGPSEPGTPRSPREKRLASPKNKSAHHSLIRRETGQKGAVSHSTIWEYLRAMGKRRLPFSFLFAICAYAFMAAADLYLANWIRVSQEITTQESHIRYAFVYIALALVHVSFVEVLSLHNTRSSVKASKNVHNECIDKILHSPIGYFESTPSGRIVARFSGDLSMVDRQLAFIFDDVFQFIFLLLGLCSVICFIVPELVPVLIIGLSVFMWQVVVVDRTNREIKRYANQALSPIVTNISEAVDARDLIRCMNLGSFFVTRHYSHVDRYTSDIYFSNSLLNFCTLAAGLVSFVLSTSAAFTVVFRRASYDPALVGLALTYSFLVPYFLSILSIVFPIGFAALTSLERILECKKDDMAQEPDWYKDIDKTLVEQGVVPCDVVVPSSFSAAAHADQGEAVSDDKVDIKIQGGQARWPSQGAVEFVNVDLRYRPELPLALADLSFRVQGRSSLGICGRTGAGKSSITLTLFRIHELCGGTIFIDGQDISKVGLQLLRSSMAIIPQFPLLFQGSFRKNIDPFSQYSDEQLHAVMDKVGLNRELLNLKALESRPEDKGGKKGKKDTTGDKGGPKKEVKQSSLSLSVGEKQLLSIARAILRDPSSRRIVVLDEPSSSLDSESDNEVQALVSREFKNATTITIAHRLRSLALLDQILVMGSGTKLEMDTPANLLRNPDSHFSGMVEQLGPAASLELRQAVFAKESQL